MSAKLTESELRKVALEHGGYGTPALNDKLFLHYKGYQRIENLDAYVGLKALWLDSNGLQAIENLSHLIRLRCLYLQRNLISTIEGLGGLKSLVHLDLSENCLTKLEGLSCLPDLATLSVANNALSNADSIRHLSKCKSIKVLDLSHNKVSGGDDVLDILSACPNLAALNLVGNPIASEMSNFRKKFIFVLKGLKYLDNPVFDKERATVGAWASGGLEAEIQTKKDWEEQQKTEDRQQTEQFRIWQANLRTEAQKISS